MLELEDYQTTFSQHRDHKAIQEKVENLLSDYPKICRRAWAFDNNKSGIGSVSFDGLPKNHTVVNTVERRIVDGIYKKQQRDVIEKSVEACDPQDCKLLQLRYGIKKYSERMKDKEAGKNPYPVIKVKTDTETYMDLDIPQSTYNHDWKPDALEHFADIYMLDDLIVYKSDKK